MTKIWCKFYLILWIGMHSGLHFYMLEFILLDDWNSWILFVYILQGKSMPYCIPPTYRFFLFRGSLIPITDHVIRLCLTKLNIWENQLIKKASELPFCDWLAHCFRVSGRGGARSRAKTLSTGWMSKREGQEVVPCPANSEDIFPMFYHLLPVSQHHSEDPSFNLWVFGGHWTPELRL